jgi:hypothetical protein
VSADRVVHRPDVDLPIDPYVFGYWLGDGNSRDSRFTVDDADYPSFLRQIERAGYVAKVMGVPIPEPDDGKTTQGKISELMKQFKKELEPHLKGFTIGTVAGDMLGKEKSDAFSFELSKSFSALEIAKVLPNVKYPGSHKFLIQGEFRRKAEKLDSSAMYWLHQAGSVISFGGPKEKIRLNDLSTIVVAVKKLIDEEDEAIKKLYSSKYDKYGRE